MRINTLWIGQETGKAFVKVTYLVLAAQGQLSLCFCYLLDSRSRKWFAFMYA